LQPRALLVARLLVGLPHVEVRDELRVAVAHEDRLAEGLPQRVEPGRGEPRGELEAPQLDPREHLELSEASLLREGERARRAAHRLGDVAARLEDLDAREE